MQERVRGLPVAGDQEDDVLALGAAREKLEEALGTIPPLLIFYNAHGAQPDALKAVQRAVIDVGSTRRFYVAARTTLAAGSTTLGSRLVEQLHLGQWPLPAWHDRVCAELTSEAVGGGGRLPTLLELDVRRPLSAAEDADAPLLLDVLLHVLLRLRATTADDPQAFLGTGSTWQGQRSIDSRLTSLFGLQQGRTVAVAADDDLLVQFATPLADVDVTVTLSDHGRRSVALPEKAETALAADHPEVAAALGV